MAKARIRSEPGDETLDDSRRLSRRLIVRPQDDADAGLQQEADQWLAAEVQDRVLAPRRREQRRGRLRSFRLGRVRQRDETLEPRIAVLEETFRRQAEELLAATDLGDVVRADAQERVVVIV